ncbi:MAG: DUF692 domain-containing protein [Pirellula sp.]|jgi:hypothetical protein|nr:DUF692 domain-containing protein [Pirellula sp.]
MSDHQGHQAAEAYVSLPSYGVGLGFRPVHREELFSHRKSIDFLEIIADHYFDPSPPKQAELELLQANFPLIPHGLALSIGSAEGIDARYLSKFRSIVEQVRPAWCSDHIAFTRAGGIDIGHLTPVPKSRASLDVIRDNLRRVQDVIHVPIILENITESIRYPEDEFSDAEFLGRICDDNQVGLLLDVTNLYINSVNHRFDPLEVVQRLPRDRIVQLHFVGGRFEEGLWVDSHDCATQDEIWQLLEAVLAMISVKGIILERDERIPPLAELIPELDRARSIFLASKS